MKTWNFYQYCTKAFQLSSCIYWLNVNIALILYLIEKNLKQVSTNAKPTDSSSPIIISIIQIFLMK